MPMTFKEGLAHLQARRVQMIPKTNRNRLRWTQGDLDAVDAILASVAKAVRKAEAREQAPADDFSGRERGSRLRRAM